MHVLALVTDAFGGRGGIAQAARDLLSAFAVQKTIQTIYVLPRSTPDPIFDLPAKISSLETPANKSVYVARTLLLAREQKPALIFCNHLFMAPLAAIVAKISGARLLVQLHGVEVWPRPTLLQRRALEAADLLLCVSRHTRASVLKHIDIAPERAVVLNNTVRAEFKPGNRTDARTKFAIKNETVLLTVGRLDGQERYKGHDQLIEALAHAEASGCKNILYVIAGDGDDRPRLEAACRAAGVEHRVRFLGNVRPADLPDLYRSADLFCLPSTGEGFGIVFLEAMACGTPALGLNKGGAPDALGDGELGRMTPLEFLPDAIVEAIHDWRRPASDLADDVNRRFGRHVFNKRAGLLISRLCSTHDKDSASKASLFKRRDI